MNDLIEQLWPAFQAESSEQLEALELALLHNAGGAIDLNAVFRYFHTLKGGCAMMGFASMEGIAHACEDLLDPVRKGKQPLDEALVDALLAAIDTLKQQMATAEKTRRDPAPAPELLARLQAMATGPDAVPVALAPAVAALVTDYPALAAAARAALPLLAEEALRPKPLRKAAGDALQRLASAAAADAPALAMLCTALADAAPGAPRQALLGELLERLHWLERLAALDAGTPAAAQALRPAMEAGFRNDLQAVGALVAAAFEPVTGAPLESQLPAAIDALESLLRQARLLRLVHSTRLLRFSLQLLREFRRGILAPSRALAEMLQVAAVLPAELLDGLEEDAPYEAMCAQVDEKLQQLTAREVQGREMPQRCEDLRRALDISADTLALLQREGMDRLEAAVARRETVAEICADPETAADAGRHFMDWLTTNGTLLGSHTLPAGAGLSFLVATPLSFAALSAALDHLEPRPRQLSLRHCAPLAEAPAASPARPAALAPAEPDTEAVRPAAGANGGTTSTLRVDSGAVDAFVNRIGEMVMLRNMMSHALQQEDIALRQGRVATLLRDRGTGQSLTAAELQECRALLRDLEAQREQLLQADARLQGSLARLQEEVLALRVVPIALVFNRLPRVVRDLAHTLGREVRLDISGEEVRIDKGMVDVLAEPMLHLVRNAIDHGIEAPGARRAAGKPAQAVLTVSARQQGNSLVVEVSDDGAGLDHDRIRERAIANGLVAAGEAAALTARELNHMIFLPGFSTARKVTEVSGRGVGMDAVKTRVMQLGGLVEVSTEAGRGTTFTLRLPLSAAIQNVILVEAGGRQLAVPERNVTEILSLPAAALQSVQGQACCLLRGVTLPLYRLARLLGQEEAAAPAGEALEVVVMSDGVYRIGLIVDRVTGRPEVFIRDIHPDLVRLPGVGGASILGDGRVVIILDCDNLFELAVRQAQSLRSLLRTS
ncbi:MAG: cheA [Moraxellaceae bacterium]|jgi:chemotaxis protein histidine kinase CheA|nr:cheA [Moraxellaceae bacterium]